MKTFTCITSISMKLRLIELMLCALLLCACGTPPLTPVDLAPEDMCAHCKMAISERRFAAELVGADGEAFKFDELGCLLNYVKAHQPTSVTWFVMDYDTREWLRAEQSHFVKAVQYHTPMNGGIVAFKTQAQAEAAVAQMGGQATDFSGLLKLPAQAGR